MDQGVTGLVRWWMDHSDDAIAKGLGMILHGSVGGGKTLLATLVLRHVLTSHPGFFTTYSGLLDMLMSSWHSQEDRDRFYRLIRNCTVLVIDDLGRERKQQRIVSAAESAATGSDRGVVQYSSALAESTFEEVVRHRVASSLPTIITTNLNPERIGQGYGGNAASLLMERSMLIEVQGEDYRTRSASRMMDEIEMGLTRPVVLG
jgi:DNA replication protein DnaC